MFLHEDLKDQLARTKTIDLVKKAYISQDQQTVVVEIHINPSFGLKRRNILFFPAENFQAEQVYQAVNRLKKPPD